MHYDNDDEDTHDDDCDNFVLMEEAFFGFYFLTWVLLRAAG